MKGVYDTKISKCNVQDENHSQDKRKSHIHTLTFYLLRKTRFQQHSLNSISNNTCVSARTLDNAYAVYMKTLKGYCFSSLFLVLTVRDLFGRDIISKHCNAG